MHKGIFVTGTGTDIGKTFVTALLVKKLHDAGSAAAYFKAAVSGNERDENGRLIPGDAAYVKRISGISQPLDTMCPYIYETAVSPHLASRIEYKREMGVAATVLAYSSLYRSGGKQIELTLPTYQKFYIFLLRYQIVQQTVKTIFNV